MGMRRTAAASLAAAAATVLVACGQGPSPEELARQTCEDLPAGVPQQQVESRITRLAEDQGVELDEEELQQALQEVDSRCPELLEQP